MSVPAKSSPVHSTGWPGLDHDGVAMADLEGNEFEIN